mmetsp:Transcript_3642/g.9120  ORF Transcript_3642/g.9120 Transcript_3642/m.9120 type:complete len:208 (+) Transcript_3642:209-832(+)
MRCNSSNRDSVSTSSSSSSSIVVCCKAFSLRAAKVFKFSRMRCSYCNCISRFCSCNNSICFLNSSSVRQRSSTRAAISLDNPSTATRFCSSNSFIWSEVDSIFLTAFWSCACSFITYCESTPPLGATPLIRLAYSWMAALSCISASRAFKRSSACNVCRLIRSHSILCVKDSFICVNRSCSNSCSNLVNSCCFSWRAFSNALMDASR